MDKRLKILAVVLTALLASVVAAIPARAASITVAAATVEANAGDTVDIAINGKGVDNIAALEMVLVYDAAVLTFNSLDPGDLGQGTSIVTNADTPGRLGISIATARAISGDGTLATAHFNVIGQAGQSSALDFANATAWEAEFLRETEVLVEPGSLTVAAGFPLWLIYGLIGLLVLLLLLFLLSRLRRKPAVAPVSYAPGGYMQPNAQAQQYANVPPAQQYGQAQYCTNCGNPNSPGSQFCATCGTQMPRPVSAPPR